MVEAHKIGSLISRLPLPLAQTLRRAINAKSPNEQHNGAYYFFESTLKLAASAQVGVYLATDNSDARINEMIEALTRPSTGHWLGLLREVSKSLGERKDNALLPLADLHKRLTEKQSLPAASAFLKFAAEAAGGNEGRQKLRPLDLLDGIVSYRNAELGHGAQRGRSFYIEASPLLVDAVVEFIEVAEPFKGLQLAVARDVLDGASQQAQRRYEILRGDGLHLPLETDEAENDDLPAGRVVLAGGKTRIQLHPLLVYEVDSMDRDRVGFLNKVATRGRGETAQIKRVEYLDYDSGERLEAHDAVEELAGLLSKVRGAQVSVDTIESMTRAETAIETDAAAPESGQWIGDFELISELGRGGMGIVYEALQGSLKRHVALKVLPPSIAGDPIAVARFKREIAALGRCDHPNVVKVLTGGQEGDRHYYAMEYVEGSDLSQVFGVLSDWRMQTEGDLREGHLRQAISNVVSNRGSGGKSAADTGDAEIDVPQKQAAAPSIADGRDYYTRIAEILADAARGVDHLHEHGIIHRDLKPGNIMLTGDSKRAVIMDLGLAQVQDRSLSLTASSVKILGTLRYMPPEQLQHNLLEVTPKADIYSLGATLYELAVLSPIYDGDTEAKLISQVLQEEPKSPRSLNGRIPKDLETIITVATSKNPGERYATAAHLADDLERFARGDPIAAKPPSTFHYLKLFYRKNRALAHTVAAALIIMVAVVAVFMQQLASALAKAEDERARAEDAEKETRTALGQSEQERERAEKLALEAQEARDDADDQRAVAQDNADDAEKALAEANRNLVRVHTEKATIARVQGRYREALAHEVAAAELALRADDNDLAQDRLKVVEATEVQTPMLVWERSGRPFQTRSWETRVAPDASLFAAIEDKSVALFDPATGQRIRTIGWDYSITDLELSPGPRYLAIEEGGGELVVLDLKTNKRWKPARDEVGKVEAMRFTADSTLVVMWESRELETWMPGESVARTAVKMPESYERGSVSISKDGNRIAVKVPDGDAEFGSSCQVHSVKTGDVVAKFSPEALSWGVELSADGGKAVTTSYDTTAVFWEFGNGEPIELKTTIDTRDVEFLPGGEACIALSGKTGPRLIDTSTGEVLWEHPERLVRSEIGFSPDGKTVLLFSNMTEFVALDIETGERASRAIGHADYVLFAALSPDEKWLATQAYDFRVYVRDAWTGEIEQGFADRFYTTKPLWTGDSRYLVCGGQEGPCMWDTLRGFEQLEFERPTQDPGRLSSLSLSRDSTELIGVFDAMLCRWSVESRHLLNHTEEGLLKRIDTIVPLVDGTGENFIGTGVLQSTCLIDAETLECTYLSLGEDMTAYEPSPDGMFIAALGENDRSLWLFRWSRVDARYERSFKLHERFVDQEAEEFGFVAFAMATNSIIVTGPDGTATGFDLDTAMPTNLVKLSPKSWVVASSASREYLFVGGGYGKTHCWRVPPERQDRLVANLSGDGVDGVLSPDGSTIYVSGEWGHIDHFAVESGRLIRRLRVADEVAEGPQIHVGLAISPGGRYLSAGGFQEKPARNARARLWDLGSGDIVDTAEIGEGYWVVSTQFSRDSSQLLVSVVNAEDGNTGEIRVYSVPGMRLERTIATPHDDLDKPKGPGVSGLALSPDGKMLAAVTAKPELLCFRYETGELLHRFEVDVSEVGWPAWHPSGDRVYVADRNGLVNEFDVTDGKKIRAIGEKGGRAARVAVTADGEYVGVLSPGKFVRVFSLVLGNQVYERALHRESLLMTFSADASTIYACLGKELMQFQTGLGGSAFKDVRSLDVDSLAQWGEARTRFRFEALKSVPLSGKAAIVDWTSPVKWNRTLPDWLAFESEKIVDDTRWLAARRGVLKKERSEYARFWHDQFEGFRYREILQDDGSIKREPVPVRPLDANGRPAGNPEGLIDYAAWFKSQLALEPDPERGEVLVGEGLNAAREDAASRRGFALIVAVGNSSYGALPGSCPDAGKVYSLLKHQYGFDADDIVVLVDQPDLCLDADGNPVPVDGEPTKKGISEAIKYIANSMLVGSEVEDQHFIFYYSGWCHQDLGAVTEQHLVLKDYWESREAGDDTHGYQLNQLFDDIHSDVPCNQRMLWLDTGPLSLDAMDTEALPDFPGKIFESWAGIAQTILTAAGNSQYAWEANGASLMTASLLRGLGADGSSVLADENGDGIVTDAELGAFVRSDVIEAAKAISKKQQPQYLREVGFRGGTGQHLLVPTGK